MIFQIFSYHTGLLGILGDEDGFLNILLMLFIKNF
jgi:hypothetical protein